MKKNLYYKFIYSETILEYLEGKRFLERKGIIISAIVLDGRPGVRKIFSDIPTQMCHFHQKSIIRRYLTNNPRLQAGIELKEIVKYLGKVDEKNFNTMLINWNNKWQYFLKEKTIDPIANHWHYTHGRIRSAYRSLKFNMPYLYTYQKYPNLNIPNTTNSLDGSFANLKELVRIHRGFNNNLKSKLIQQILSN